jgi:biotin synthase
MNRAEIVAWLRETNAAKLEKLWAKANACRAEHVGQQVHLRGLVEISSNCARNCHYCGLRCDNRQLKRYRMTAEEILNCAQQAVEFGYGTVVLQSGEDYGIQTDWISEIIRQIKRLTPLAVTLSLGERPDADLAVWRQAGADRYLLRFETSNRRLYEQIHPTLKTGSGQKVSDRFAILRRLRDLGYEIGSGVMIGIPGQSYADLANDIQAFVELDLEMIGMGPFLPHPQTPLGEQMRDRQADSQVPPDQPANDELTTYKMIALARLSCPDANIPSTTALATINRAEGRELGLMRGANIVMPNLTPVEYRAMYEIYPAKACIFESAAQCQCCLTRRIQAIGREVGQGRGDSPRLAKRFIMPDSM